MKQNKKNNHNNIANLSELLSRKKLNVLEFYEKLDNCYDKVFEDNELEIELLISNGLPLTIHEDFIYLKTLDTFISEQVFCIVDIETNGNNIKNGQIIELGAVKYQNGKIIDSYESLVYAKDIPSYVQEVTKITPQMLIDAPPLRNVLEEFKIFLEDDVFVAHDIKFDYKFISDSLEKYDLGKLQNRKLCTIDLAKRTIESQRYGLGFLKELLNIDIGNHHRAYSDALSTTYILEKSISLLSEKIKTTEDLIHFSKEGKVLIPQETQKRENNV